jgi:hypothetical protein
MNAVTNIWRQLVRSKLWPVALLLVAALVAIPMLLAREPAAPEPIAPVAVNTEADDSIAEPIVAKVTAEDRDRRRRVLGVRKDPFKPAPIKLPKVEPSETPEVSKPDAPSTGDTGGGGGGGGGTVGGGEPAEAPVFYKPGTIIVRFGEAESDTLDRFAIPKLGPVPDDEFPLLVYMGLTKNGKKAKFLVDAALEVEGDGTCKPHPASCEIIELAVGETEFLDVINPDTSDEATSEDGTEETVEETEPEVLGTYQLDLVDIKRAGDSDVR